MPWQQQSTKGLCSKVINLDLVQKGSFVGNTYQICKSISVLVNIVDVFNRQRFAQFKDGTTIYQISTINKYLYQKV